MLTPGTPQQHQRLRAEQLMKLGELSMSSGRENEVHIIGLAGELDLASAAALHNELERVEATDAQSIILDLSELAFIDSTGVRLLLTAHARSRADSNRLTMLRGSAAVQRVLELTGVEDQLPFAD